MNLISCENCGVVLDKDKLNFPVDIWLDDVNWQEVDETKAVWDGEEFKAIVPCPVCKDMVKES